jgi:glycosyltransferase 2 family protein
VSDSSAGDEVGKQDAPSRWQALFQSAMTFAKRNKRLLQIALVTLIALFVVLSLMSNWSKLASYDWRLNWGLFALAFLFFAGQELTFAFIWRAILRRMGHTIAVLAAQRMYLGSEMARYVPGNVWHVLTRVLWVERYGVPMAKGFASMVTELATKIASAALVFAVSLLWWQDTRALANSVPRPALIGVVVVGVPLLLLGLHPRALRWALNKGLRILKRDEIDLSLRYRDVLAVTGYWAASWLVAGVGFYLLIRAVVPTPLPASAILVATGVYALAWDIGFLSFVTPSGIGFREAALVALLLASGLIAPGPASVGVATVIALLARLLTTLAELACIGGAQLVTRLTATAPLPQPDGPRR